jgi:hypothetical protein
MTLLGFRLSYIETGPAACFAPGCPGHPSLSLCHDPFFLSFAGSSVLSRLLAAVLGGYLLASALAVFLATVLSAPRAEAVLAGMLWSFAVYVLAVIWAFSPVSPGRVWLGLLLPGVVWQRHRPGWQEELEHGRAENAGGAGQGGFRQAQAWLHTWCGLWFSWLLFAVFLTGTLAVFEEPISHWMTPEHHARSRRRRPPGFRPAWGRPGAAAGWGLAYMEKHHPGAEMWELWPSDAEGAGDLRVLVR